jgi:hypothetical protein
MDVFRSFCHERIFSYLEKIKGGVYPTPPLIERGKLYE